MDMDNFTFYYLIVMVLLNVMGVGFQCARLVMAPCALSSFVGIILSVISTAVTLLALLFCPGWV